jgi:hypothetical protein
MIIMNNSKDQTINTAFFKENIKEFTTATNILTDLTFQITEMAKQSRL